MGYYLNEGADKDPDLVSLDPKLGPEQVIENVETFYSYLNQSGNQDEYEYALMLLRGGQNFIRYKLDGEIVFAPTKFLGYKNNTMKEHEEKLYEGRDGRVTTDRFNKLFEKCEPNESYNKELIEFYNRYSGGQKTLSDREGKKPRRFWSINDESPALANEEEKLTSSYEVEAGTRNVEYLHKQLRRDFIKHIKRDNEILEDSIKIEDEHIDVVYETENAIYLIELKPYTDNKSYSDYLTQAVGQILRYYAEYSKLKSTDKQVILQIVMKGYPSDRRKKIQRRTKFETLIKEKGIDLLMDEF